MHNFTNSLVIFPAKKGLEAAQRYHIYQFQISFLYCIVLLIFYKFFFFFFFTSYVFLCFSQFLFFRI